MGAEKLSIKTDVVGLKKADVDEYIDNMVHEFSATLAGLQKQVKFLERTKSKLIFELEKAKLEEPEVVYEDEMPEHLDAPFLTYSDTAHKRLNKTIALINQIADQRIQEMIDIAAQRLEEYDSELEKVKNEMEEAREKIERLLSEVVDLLKTNMDDVMGNKQPPQLEKHAKKEEGEVETIGKILAEKADALKSEAKLVPGDGENVIDFFDNKKRSKPALTLVPKEVESTVIKNLETYHHLKGEFVKRLDDILTDDSIENPGGAVLLLQLNDFIMANYFLNSSTGDTLTNLIMSQMKELDEEVYIERLSYDQIGVICDGKMNKNKLAEFAQSVLAYIQKGLYVDGKKIDLSANIGIALYNKETGSAELVMNYAGIALYKANERGRGEYQFVDDELISKVKFSNDLKSDLMNAISNHEFALFYQPQYAISENKLMGFEALLRWQNAKYHQMSIYDVIKIAEKENLIHEIGSHLFRMACLFTKQVQNKSNERIIVSVNFSSMQLTRDDFVYAVKTIMEETGVDPEYLGFEITESCFMNCMEETCSKLQQIKNLGITISIDDFGTGYSTLSYLLKLPVSIIKIDKSFLNDLTTSKRSEVFISSIISIAHNLGLKVIAEGVETERQYDMLKAMDCDYIQGFYMAKPAPENEAYMYLN